MRTTYKIVWNKKGIPPWIPTRRFEKQFMKGYNEYADRTNRIIPVLNKMWNLADPDEGIQAYNRYMAYAFQQVCNDINHERIAPSLEFWVDPDEAWIHARVRSIEDSDLTFSMMPVEEGA